MAEFKNRIDAQDRGSRAVRSPWDFSAPDYDERSGPCINAGCAYGVGVNQKTGTEKSSDTYAVPMDSKCFSPDKARED